MQGERARKLTLIDPETGAALSRGRTWLAAWLIVFGTSFMSLVVVALSPVLPEVAAHFGQGYDGKFVAQLIQVTPSIGVIFGAPASGWLVERAGSRRFLLAVLPIFGLAGSAGLYLDTIWGLVATRLILGVGAAGIVTATLFMIGEYFESDMRARILGYQSAVGAVAAMLIGLTAGQLAHLAGWRAPFGLYLVAFAFVAGVAYAIPRNRTGRRPVARTETERVDTLSSLWRLLPLLALTVALFAASYVSIVQVPFLLNDDGVTSPRLRALVVAVGALTVSAGSASYGFVQARLGDRWTLRLCCLLLALGIAGMGLAPTGLLIGLACAVAGLGTGIANPQVNNMLISSADPSVRGRAIGFGYTARYLGQFLNPVIVGMIAAPLGLHGALAAAGAAFVAGVILDTIRKPA